ncbi:nucleoside kinase [Aduncisulcus paluster]|uniref:Nucleoside kinase n=1 Tax=Aduncisulcus paluster TaxID=2918883 RepID=A0ABQ5K2N4_9EUKA|nr:nucleoside kinase [Aduncisulcus paluster]|eukprot:gnl/Carplike_NY0171/2086_a2807_751.p1 GENE.gnl/Carplike_NY0171/2086_a2807_751~~gnl/Carplike_NY0171/2086_a2807_751.p1  ORF type:complete len:580 (+),score=137.45 gnl/Carplike_NY0171/2086_a2807_751:2-1741(+)
MEKEEAPSEIESNMVTITLTEEKTVGVKIGTPLLSFVTEHFPTKKNKEGKIIDIYGAYVNNQATSLIEPIIHDCSISPIYGDTVIGAMIYRRSLYFLTELVTRALFPDRMLIHSYTTSRSIICYFDGMEDEGISEDDVEKIEENMLKFVHMELKLRHVFIPFSAAISYLEKERMTRTVDIIAETNNPTIEFVECKWDERKNSFKQLWIGPVVPHLGYLKVFKVSKFEHGFIVRYPSSCDPTCLVPFDYQPKQIAAYRAHTEWCKAQGILGIGYLNRAVHEHRVKEFIHICEAKHDKEYFKVAEFIEKENKRLICLAGPSSSGKTTSSQKISMFLRSYGIRPVLISLDNYYLDADDPRMPRDEKGDLNLEIVESLDHELLNQQLADLLKGREVEIPVYNFKLGKRAAKGLPLRLPPKGVIFIEGINSHDDRCSSDIPIDKKVKVFVCPLTVVDRRLISPMDLRLVRRICRDALFRGTPASKNIAMWPDVRRAEKKIIFDMIETAGIVINTSLDYELGVLKVFAVPLLRAIPVTDPTYGRARELLASLQHFATIPAEFVPERCVLREFLPEGSMYAEFFEE